MQISDCLLQVFGILKVKSVIGIGVAQDHILLFILFHFFNLDLPIFAQVKFYGQVPYYLTLGLGFS